MTHDNSFGFDNEEEIPLSTLMELSGFAEQHDLNDRAGGIDEGRITRWRDLPDEDAQEQWARLRSFVDWLVDRYAIPESEIPACWPQHPPIVEELSALRASWDTAFDPGDGGYGPVGWHERFAAVRQRISSVHYKGACHVGRGHQPAYSLRKALTNEDSFTAAVTDAPALTQPTLDWSTSETAA